MADELGWLLYLLEFGSRALRNSDGVPDVPDQYQAEHQQLHGGHQLSLRRFELHQLLIARKSDHLSSSAVAKSSGVANLSGAYSCFHDGKRGTQDSVGSAQSCG